jgi:putative lipoprotein
LIDASLDPAPRWRRILPFGLLRAGMIARASVALLVLLGAPASAGTLRGQALYRERLMLPPHAVFEAVLLDVSRADAPADILGRARLEPAGQPPFPFEIAYDDAALRPGRRYTVRATLTLDGRLLFTTDTVNSAFGGARPLELVMVRTNAPQNRLRGAYWKLTRLGDSPVQAGEPQREPHFILAQEKDEKGSGTVSGSGGCNRFNGGFTLEGDQLRFSKMASTMMACADGMEQEGSFLKNLASVARYRITGDQLELLDDSGATLMLFTAVALR